MENKQPEHTAPFCQSCSMPMSKNEDFGTNADGSLSHEYCHYCFADGKFTSPDATVEDVINMSVNAMRQMKMSEALIEQTMQFIPGLKRWKRD